MAETTPSGSSAARKTHPLVVVAAGAVTLFCLVGIGVMTGIIPGAQSGPVPKAETVAAPPTAAGVAMAPIGSATEAALPQSAPPSGLGAPTTVLPPIKSDTLGQPNAKLDARAGNPPATPAKANAAARSSTNSASGVPTSSANSVSTTPPTPVYAASASQAGTTGAANPPASQSEQAPAVSRPPPPQICRQCGTVEQITQIQEQGQASGTGAVLGGLIGGVVGHQVGSGRGKDVATVAGAVGGALLGNQIEKSSGGKAGFDVRVRMEDNTFRTAKFEGEPGFRIGDRVRFDGGRLVRR